MLLYDSRTARNNRNEDFPPSCLRESIFSLCRFRIRRVLKDGSVIHVQAWNRQRQEGPRKGIQGEVPDNKASFCTAVKQLAQLQCCSLVSHRLARVSDCKKQFAATYLLLLANENHPIYRNKEPFSVWRPVALTLWYIERDT